MYNSECPQVIYTAGPLKAQRHVSMSGSLICTCIFAGPTQLTYDRDPFMHKEMQPRPRIHKC